MDKSIVIDMKLAASLLPERDERGHKGSFGRLLIRAGSPSMPGAAALCAAAAVQSGVGICQVAAPEPVVRSVSARLSEPLYRVLTDGDISSFVSAFPTASAAVFGPGVGLSDQSERELLALLESGIPRLLIDADGITLLSAHKDRLRKAGSEILLTPHPGEMARLTGLPVEKIRSDREACAREFAVGFGVTVLLKGADTVIASPSGETRLLPVACSGLAKGGSGDVLSGLCGSLAAQGLCCFDAASLGAYIHARAGVIGSECYTAYCMTPSRLIEIFPEVFGMLLG